MTNADFGRRYFSKPPQKSFYFWMATIYLVVVLSMALLLGERFYGRPGSSGVGGGLWWMCLSVAAPIILWIRAWQSHAKLHEMSMRNNGSDLEDRVRFDMVLTEAAYLENTGLGIALFVLMSALLGLSRILSK